jgi:hypothetical protein
MKIICNFLFKSTLHKTEIRDISSIRDGGLYVDKNMQFNPTAPAVYWIPVSKIEFVEFIYG